MSAKAEAKAEPKAEAAAPAEGAEEKEQDLSSPDAVTKYKMAADFANKALKAVEEACVVGASVVALCELGDQNIKDSVAPVFNKGKVEKGIAFPTCVSVNHCVGHNSPIASEGVQILAAGDFVKIDLGVHIDGFIAVVANTIVLTDGQPITGRQADVIAAAHAAANVALHTLRPGVKNSEVTEKIMEVARLYNVNPIEGVQSHQMRKFVLDGQKVIANKFVPERRVEEVTFEENEVYALDLVFSTGDGKPRETEVRTTVFKRIVDQNYSLKMKASRYVFNEINTKFPTMPFTIREFDEKRGRLGIVECVNHELLQPYPVPFEKPGDFVAQVKFTVLLMPSGTLKITGSTLPDYVKSEVELSDELKAVLATSTKKNNKKKKKAAAASDAAPAAK